MGAGGGDQALEQARVFRGVLLGMPLHGDAERGTGQLDGLDDAVAPSAR